MKKTCELCGKDLTYAYKSISNLQRHFEINHLDSRKEVKYVDGHWSFVLGDDRDGSWMDVTTWICECGQEFKYYRDWQKHIYKHVR